MSTSGDQRYRFGPLERTGLIGSLRPTQVIIIAVSLTAGVILMRTLSSGAGVVSALALALLAAGLCFWPINGRSVEEWLPIVTKHAWRHVRGRHIQLSPAPQAGARLAPDGRPEPVAALPEGARDLELLAAPFNGNTVGVIKDGRAHTVHGSARGQGDVVRAPRPSRTGEQTGGLGQRPRRLSPERALPSAGSSGSSARFQPMATRSAATSARSGNATPSRSIRSRCSPISTSRALRPP